MVRRDRNGQVAGRYFARGRMIELNRPCHPSAASDGARASVERMSPRGVHKVSRFSPRFN